MARSRPARPWRAARRRPARSRTASFLEVDDDLEPAVEETLAVERHLLRVHHRREALVLHHLLVHAVAVLAVLVDDPGKPHGLAGLELHRLRERGPLALLHVVGDALLVVERAVLAPHLARLGGHLAIGRVIPLRYGQYESVDI